MAKRRPPLYVLPGSNPGLLVKGNIDINNRPSVKNPLGGTSSVFSTSFGITVDRHRYEVLVTRVVNGRILSTQQAILYYRRTGRHLGIFDTPLHATRYAQKLHKQQASLMGH